LGFFLVLLALTQAGGDTKDQSGKPLDKKSGQICITFDEVPAARTFGDADREAITYLTLSALKKHGVSAAGFVVGEQIGSSYDILGQWLNEGHTLGNLGYSAQDYNRLGPEQFIGDIRKGADELEPMLDGFGQKRRYFRFPYLHYGDSVERRRAVTLFLEDNGWVVSPATVIPEDYLYNLTLAKLGKKPDSAKFEQLLNDYINHVLDELERQERLAVNLVGRPIRQILLLRANRLNAVYLDELLTALEESGYSFVSLETAHKDKVYQMAEAYYGMKGLSYLEMIGQSDPDLLPAE
jgi:peptidoglycan/xylan/chitin deacetylase (PgdA/CDA1 family)